MVAAASPSLIETNWFPVQQKPPASGSSERRGECRGAVVCFGGRVPSVGRVVFVLVACLILPSILYPCLTGIMWRWDKTAREYLNSAGPKCHHRLCYCQLPGSTVISHTNCQKQPPILNLWQHYEPSISKSPLQWWYDVKVWKLRHNGIIPPRSTAY